MTDRLSTVQPFEVGGVLFRCWIVDDGVNEIGVPSERYEWRSDDGVCRVGKNSGNAMSWAALRGRIIGQHYQTRKAAMEAVVKAYERATKAA